jgi:malate dehydrogenase (oxaloacetate-decarboxylating)
MLGAGASNTTIAKFILEAGGDPERLIMFDTKGALHAGRTDIEADSRFYKKWELCRQTNLARIGDIDTAMKGADVLIALSKPGPGTVRPEWIRSMGNKPIVFVCANPVPEIYPYAAKEAGAYIVATGRGDFPNQVNNSVGFPGILKGALLVRAKGITDGMAITAARSLADFAERRGITPENIIAAMDEPGVFPHEAADVAAKAVEEGTARLHLSREEAYIKAEADIKQARAATHALIDGGFIPTPPDAILEEAYQRALREV